MTTSDSELTRKLAVILHADVVGSTSLVQIDETLAHERIHDTFVKLSKVISDHGGVAHEIRGDALVAEFDKPSDALLASTSFQEQNDTSNAGLQDNIKPHLRIGIGLGEVIVANNTITGAGVVIAQRLEQLADPGGVVVQGSISEIVPNRFAFEFDSLGEQSIKGFGQPIRAFAVKSQRANDWDEKTMTGDEGSADEAGLGRVEKPSIAVLPFTNMSNDPEQEFFSDGISEDIITELSKVSALTVIARNSTFIYKNKAVDVREVGKDLGVRYVLEGSVRKSGQRVRVTAQLVDAENGQHLWAERYDRELEDVFVLQDEIMREIVSALDVEILSGEQSRFWSEGTRDLRAWEFFRQARDLFSHYRSKDHPEVIRLCNKALECDPKYSAAWHLLANCNFHIEDDTRYSDSERSEAGGRSREYLEKSIECDPCNPGALSLRAMHHLTAREFDKAINCTNEAVAGAPGYAHIVASSAMILNKCGQPDVALQRIQKAMKLCPVYPLWYLITLGQVNRLLGRADEAIAAYKEMVRRDPDHIEGHIGLAAVLAETGSIELAKESTNEVLRIFPKFSIKRYLSNIAYRDQSILSDLEKALLAAGLPK